MARAKTKRDTRGPLQRALDNIGIEEAQGFLDVITPEMARRGDYSAIAGGRRYYRLSHLDRLYRAKKLTHDQHEAGNWYRTQWDAGQYDSSRTADWTRMRGENVVSFTLPTRAQDARDRWREARSIFPARMVGFMDRFLLHDDWPRFYQHRDRSSNLATLRQGLDMLATYLR